MSMFRWLRWWLTVITVGSLCLHIVNAAGQDDEPRAHFKSVPKVQRDGTRDINLPTVNSPYGEYGNMTWFDMFASLLGGQKTVDPTLFTMPQYGPVAYPSEPAPVRASRERQGTLDRSVSGGTRNTSFGVIRSQ